MGMASGWYKREFDAVGMPFEKRGKIMDENLEILRRLWTEEQGQRQLHEPQDLQGRHVPEAVQQPHVPILIGGYVDRVLQRAGDGRRRLAHLFLHGRRLHEILERRSALRRRGGRQGPATSLSTPRSCRSWSAPSREAVREEMMDWLNKEWDFPVA